MCIGLCLLFRRRGFKELSSGKQDPEVCSKYVEVKECAHVNLYLVAIQHNELPESET